MMTARNTMGGERPRNAADFYPTPDALALAIAQRIREEFGEVGQIVEPSAGAGAFVRAARAMWPGAWIQAIEPGSRHGPALCEAGADVVRQLIWEDAVGRLIQASLGPNLVLGNPPFSLAEAHVRIALDRMRDGDVLALLLRASFLAGQARTRGLFAEAPPSHVWHVAPRPSFTGDGKTDGAEYAVVVWTKGQRGPYAGGWLQWQREAK